MIYDFQDFSVNLISAIKIKLFDDKPHYYGVIFKVHNDNMNYQLIHNILMGYRLHIYNDYGYMKDLPFHKETEKFLPDNIKIEWKKIL